MTFREEDRIDRAIGKERKSETAGFGTGSGAEDRLRGKPQCLNH